MGEDADDEARTPDPSQREVARLAAERDRLEAEIGQVSTRPAEGGLRYNSTAAFGKWDLTSHDQQEAPEW